MRGHHHELRKYYLFVLHELRKYLENADTLDVIVGLSGGIDSALVATIATDAFGSNRVQTVMMPSPYTSTNSIDDALEVAYRLGVAHMVIRIDGLLQSFKEVFSQCMTWEEQDITEQNLQSRIRAVILMGLSNKTNSLVLSTSNRSEILTGYFTLYGDSSGGYAPISPFLKTQVYKLAQWRNSNIPESSMLQKKNVIPDSVLRKAPTAELKYNQKDCDTLPEYDILDQILTAISCKQDLTTLSIDEGIVSMVVERVRKSEYKRRYLPIGPDLLEMN
ncbi:NAD(+) synthase [Neorickettsia sp. 179522]|uniref:NAD(+) synthase n=1 Tax=Neorickettsia sp. 179522 TaxID=1714371 RepID=UPI000795514F|nr:NAD(+) synthase [Neorickettsia sp. 179522]KYH12273.1 NAD(+) synthetase [Neorickettsia sp. 179522]